MNGADEFKFCFIFDKVASLFNFESYSAINLRSPSNGAE